ncbi:MAG: hypothetical protein ACFFD4_14955, partial [Candidatus Odinarchaeota archaeon]
INNWAILAAENEVKWHFGDIRDEKMLLQTLDFVNALSKLGSELWGQGIGTIRLRYPRSHPTQAREIMVVNLLDKYSIVISDPLVTTRLMTKIQTDSDVIPNWIDDMRSILAGTASVIYSQFYSYEELIDRKIVDELFEEAVKAVTYNEDVTVGNGQCSFSALTIEELLFFHALLKDLFETYISTTVPDDPWGIICSITGAPIHLEFEPPVNGALISAFSSVIVAYCQILFGASPERLVFGGHSMLGMDFIATDKHIFVISNPSKLFKLQRFVREWKRIPVDIVQDLAPSMKNYLAELSIIRQREKIRKMEFHQVINRLTTMGIRRARAYQLLPTDRFKI